MDFASAWTHGVLWVPVLCDIEQVLSIIKSLPLTRFVHCFFKLARSLSVPKCEDEYITAMNQDLVCE